MRKSHNVPYCVDRFFLFPVINTTKHGLLVTIYIYMYCVTFYLDVTVLMLTINLLNKMFYVELVSGKNTKNTKNLPNVTHL